MANKLAEYGIDKIFVVYGAANGDLIDAFTRTNKTNYVSVMHEQAGGFAAEVYSKISGKPGVAIATSGPGGMNMLTSMGNCFYDSVPCIFITGQINSKFLRTDESIRQIGFQESDIISMAKPVTKYAKMILDPLSVKYEIEKAYYTCKTGRPGPVLLDIPLDVQKKDIDVSKLYGFENISYQESTNNLNIFIKNYIKDLKSSERPVLLIGGGVRISNAVTSFRKLGNLMKIPCFPTWNALDTVTSDYKYFAGSKDPIEIVNKYRQRGYSLPLNDSEKIRLTKYSVNIDKWNILYDKPKIKQKIDIDNMFGYLHINANYFRPRRMLNNEFTKIKPVDDIYTNVNNNIDEINEYSDMMDIMYDGNNKPPFKRLYNLCDLRIINNYGYVKQVKKWYFDAIYENS